MAYVVRYGRMRYLGEYVGQADHDYPRGQRVVIRSDRGTEIGEVLCPATERTAAVLESRNQGEILRPASAHDMEQETTLPAAQEEAFEVCREAITRRRLQMELVDVEIVYGRERIVFYYLAEKRVDFRELVKDLARALRTRIEMRQIGVRDEAKLLADYGDCGKPVCCNTHLTAMPPVSMKMAKLQKTTLDPAKISGRCGRLKCCLRYEFDTYRDLEQDLPPVGAQILTPKGKGKVVAQEILAGKLVIEFEDRRRIIVGRDDVLGVLPPPSRPDLPPGRTTRKRGVPPRGPGVADQYHEPERDHGTANRDRLSDIDDADQDGRSDQSPEASPSSPGGG